MMEDEMRQNIYDILRYLVEWAAPPETRVLSLYLDLSEDAEQEACEFARAAWDDLLVQHAEAPGIEALDALAQQELEQLPARVERARQRDHDGLALFLGHEPPLRQWISLRFPFENQAQVGRDPFLRHLLSQAEEYEQCVAVVLQADLATVCEIHIGDLVRARQVAPTLRRDLAGELNTVLARLVRDEPHLHLIIMGKPARRDAVVARLSQDVQTRVLQRVDRAVSPGEPGFLRVVHRCLQDHERRSEAAGVARLLRLRAQGEEVAVGPDDTLACINRGKLKVLYVLQSFSLRGWLCDVCDYLGELPAPPFCLACGATVSDVPLEEHVHDQAAACGAEIDTVFSSEDLFEVGGIGAIID